MNLAAAGSRRGRHLRDGQLLVPHTGSSLVLQIAADVLGEYFSGGAIREHDEGVRPGRSAVGPISMDEARSRTNALDDAIEHFPSHSG